MYSKLNTFMTKFSYGWKSQSHLVAIIILKSKCMKKQKSVVCSSTELLYISSDINAC